MRNQFKKYAFVLVAISVFLSSCKATKEMSKAQKGVAIGAAGGAILGGILGNNLGKNGNTALGAIIGATVGGVAGGVIGNKMDKQAEKIKEEIPGAEVTRVGEGIDVVFTEKNPDGSKAGVYFATNKFDINANSKLALDKLVKIFNEYPETNILIEGHTDDTGTDAVNLTISEKRAQAVGAYLKAQGISESRLTIKWYGESQPRVPNTDAASRAENRRVQFAITANEKMQEEAKKEANKAQ